MFILLILKNLSGSNKMYENLQFDTFRTYELNTMYILNTSLSHSFLAARAAK